MTLIDPFAFALASAGIFAGALVSGLVGFAFSAVAGVVLLHILPPIEAVPMMMACSIVTQVASLIALRGAVEWRCSPLLIVSGLFGVIPALYLLSHIEAGAFRIGFGLFLAGYAALMLFRPTATAKSSDPSRLRYAFVGFGGGLVGGLTAMPGALPTIWCDLRGLPKDQQRAVVQPYIVALQIFALALLLTQDTFTHQALVNLACGLPALIAGVALGIMMFRRVSNTGFRSAVLVVLFFAGVLLTV